jgi:molybdopterin/thiamine biosynthesis adenylyltransferase
MLDGVGELGQERLLTGRVLIIGAGGLGSPAALYLAAAGVGSIGIADSDIVDLSNLQRQILHATADIGVAKTASAVAKLAAINPDLTLTAHQFRIERDNIAELLAQYDFVLDCTDNFDAKFLINDACVSAGKPYSHGGILKYSGQTMTVLPGKSACYRCIFPAAPDETTSLACSRAGVLGVLPGIIGTIQATEAIKSLVGIGELLLDRLLTYDSLKMKFREVPLRRSPHCPACSSLQM